MSATSCVIQRAELLGRAPHSRLQAGKREMGLVASQHRPRQVEATRISLARAARSTAGPPGKAEPQQLRRLVEGFAQRVIDGRAEPLVSADAAHDQELRMPAGNQQQQIRAAAAFGETHCQRVRLKVDARR